eukprot:SAG31_NODE_2600_length_5414_cov_3.077140_6_plen_127_part_00
MHVRARSLLKLAALLHAFKCLLLCVGRCYLFAPPPLLPDLNLDRYKFVVQVVIGEQRGEGVRYDGYISHQIAFSCSRNDSPVGICRMGARCFWDENTDAYAQEVYMNVRRLVKRHSTAVSSEHSCL